MMMTLEKAEALVESLRDDEMCYEVRVLENITANLKGVPLAVVDVYDELNNYIGEF